jgi:hypothetical protein
MTRARLDGHLLFWFGSALFVVLGVVGVRTSPISMVDLRGYYYGARCLLQHSDPYKQSELLHVYQAQGGDSPSDHAGLRQSVTTYVNVPSAFLFTAPIALLPWGPACLVWNLLTGASFLLAAYLMWSVAAEYAPAASGALMCFFLFNSALLLAYGNAAGVALSLCVIGAWCFIKERFTRAGILCLALSLAIKPHIAGPVWLFFLLAGGRNRKRALQTLAVTAILSLPMILWVSYVGPHWISELRANLQTMALTHGDLNDPGPAAVDARSPGSIVIDMQSAISLFRDDPRLYSPASYLLCAPLLMLWAIAALRKRYSQESAWLALTAISALCILPIYHRMHDTRILLFVFPAFGILWIRGGAIKWLALAFSGAGTVFLGVLPTQILATYSTHLRQSTHGLTGTLLAIIFTRPAPLILLAMGIFYLWAYVRYTPTSFAIIGHRLSGEMPPAPAQHASGSPA